MKPTRRSFSSRWMGSPACGAIVSVTDGQVGDIEKLNAVPAVYCGLVTVGIAVYEASQIIVGDDNPYCGPGNTSCDDNSTCSQNSDCDDNSNCQSNTDCDDNVQCDQNNDCGGYFGTENGDCTLNDGCSDNNTCDNNNNCDDNATCKDNNACEDLNSCSSGHENAGC